MRGHFLNSSKAAVAVAVSCVLVACWLYRQMRPLRPEATFRFAAANNSRGPVTSNRGPLWVLVATNAGRHDVFFRAESIEYKMGKRWIRQAFPTVFASGRYRFSGWLKPTSELEKPFALPHFLTNSGMVFEFPPSIRDGVSLAPTNSSLPWRVRFRCREAIDVGKILSHFGYSINAHCFVPWSMTVVSEEAHPGSEPTAAPNGGPGTSLSSPVAPEGRHR